MTRSDVFLFVFLVLLWGSAYSMMKTGFAYFPPVLYAALMFEVAGILMLPVLIYQNISLMPRTGPEWGQVAIGALFLIAGYHAFLFLGQQYTSTVYAAVVVSASPIVTAVLAGLILPDRAFSWGEIIGLLVSFTGVVILLFGRHPEDPLLGTGLIGVGPILIFAGVLAFDGGVVVLKFMGNQRSPHLFLTWSMLGGGALLLLGAIAVAGERVSAVTLNRSSVLIFSYFTLGPTLAGHLIYYYLIDRMDVVKLNLVSYFTPLCAAVIGYLWLHERPRWSTVIGFVLVLFGFVVSRVIRSGANTGLFSQGNH